MPGMPRIDTLRGLLRLGPIAACIPLLLMAGCGDDAAPGTTTDAGDVDGGGQPARYHATVRWTSYGVPHFLADDMPSVAYASGYVTSKDTVCILADQIVRLRSERSRYFGAGEMDANLTSDFGILAADVRKTALSTFPELDPESRDIVIAYAAGYNRYLDETTPDELPEPCRGAEWVKPITPEDLWAYYYYLSMGPGIDSMFDRMGDATPDTSAASAPLPMRSDDAGSNAWAIGTDRSANGHGMLLASPHLPWQGPRRLYEQHITVPGVANVYGAGWTGLPLIAIGFNEDVAFTHTASAGNHSTLYELELVRDKPTHYMFDGEEREMSEKDYAIDVKQADGSVSVVHRTLYRSRYGPMLGGFGTPWASNVSAYTYRDANEGNIGLLRTYLGMNRAHGLAELEAAQADARGLSWLNVIAVSKSGTALFFDATRAPALSDAAEQAYRAMISNDYETALFRNTRETLLVGKTPLFDWQDRDPRVPGIRPHSDSPRLERSDFVANANDTYWLTNPDEPLTGFPTMFGNEPDNQSTLVPTTLLSARTRMNFKLLTETGKNGASGADGKFSFEELSAVPYNNRGMMAELLRDAAVKRCKAQPTVDVNGKTVDLGTACSVLADWDLRVDADSIGAPLWREFLGDFFNLALGAAGVFEDGFDPSDPIGTPGELVHATEGGDAVLSALGRAVDRLASVGADESVTLGELQFAQRGGERVPLHGGVSVEGTLNVVEYAATDGTLLPGAGRGPVLGAAGLTAEGYPVNAGSSFMLVASFTDEGPRARALLTYSQSSDPDSPHYADQMPLFANKEWRDVHFSEEEIAADPELHEETVEVPPR